MNTSDQKSEANVRLTLTGAQFSVLAFIINSDKSAEAVAEFAKVAAKRVGPEAMIHVLNDAIDMRARVLDGISIVKEAVVVNNQLEGIIDV